MEIVSDHFLLVPGAGIPLRLRKSIVSRVRGLSISTKLAVTNKVRSTADASPASRIFHNPDDVKAVTLYFMTLPSNDEGGYSRVINVPHA